jgi:hypothetical protein
MFEYTVAKGIQRCAVIAARIWAVAGRFLAVGSCRTPAHGEQPIPNEGGIEWKI